MSLSKLAVTFAMLLTGQAPASDVVYTKLRVGDLPAEIDPARRDEVRELRLYISSDQGRSWYLASRCFPGKSSFKYDLKADGEYWLQVATVNQQGKQEPDDAGIYKLPPKMKMIVDTQAPVLKILSAQRQGDELVVSWEVTEQFPDAQTLTLEYRAADATAWVPVPLAASPVGTKRVPLSTAAPLVVRMHFKDLAGNAAADEKTVPGGVAVANFNGQSPNTTVAAPPQPALKTADPPVPVPPSAPVAVPPVVDKQPPVVDKQPPVPLPGMPRNDLVASTPLPTHPQMTQPQVSAQSEVIGTNKANGQGSLLPGPGAYPVASRQTPALQLVNDREILVEYEVAKVGPSGIGSVEVWITRDGGATWGQFATDPDALLATSGGKYQRTLQLPGDGVYGISLVVKSKVGMGKPPPSPGEAPQMVVEVDTVAPDIELRKPVPDAARANALVLCWTVADRNLGPEPITLEWAEQPTGPWQPIATKLPNTGNFSWQLPQKMPARVYLRLTAIDNAGNFATVVSNQPELVDMSVPEGYIFRVAPANRK
jgi:hypothetical protein